MDKLHKPSTHKDRTKYDRKKEKWSWMCSDAERFDKSKMKYTDGDNT